jgi:thiamine biosynthesis protein ThiI
LIILRYSEVGLKGNRARRMMEDKLRHNVREGLRRVDEVCSISSEKGRIFLDNYGDPEKVKDVLGRTMGVKSFSPVLKFKFSVPEEVVKKAVELYSEQVHGKKFAVRARRAGGQNFTSRELNVMVGDALYPVSAGVDLEHPEIEINIELRNNMAYFFTESYSGPGGLPIGSESPMVALVSGGIDSPVAAWMLLKRGSPINFVFVSLSDPIDTLDFLRAVRPLVEKWGHGYNPVIHIVDGGLLIKQLVVSGKFKVPGVTYKRILYRIAESIAKESGALGIVTGESLGQVSSQTPENLNAINRGITLPVYRPLIGFDKDEITEIARRIGTFPETSKGEFCALFSQTVVLDASPEDIDRDMKNFSMMDELLGSRKVIRGDELSEYLKGISDEDYEITNMPEDSVVIDLRSPVRFKEWHYPGAINSKLGKLEEIIKEKGKDRIFVFYCQKGLQSAYAASEARNLGVRSYYTSSDKMLKIQRKMINSESVTN